MRRAGLCQGRAKVEWIPSPQQSNISLLVSRCLSTGRCSSIKGPVAKTRCSWRPSMQHVTLPAIKSSPNTNVPEARSDEGLSKPEPHPVSPRLLTSRNVQRITVDLRAALARVHEPCECTEETLNKGTVSPGVNSTGDPSALDGSKSQEPENTKILKANPHLVTQRSRREEDSFKLLKIRIPLPPIANPPSQTEPAHWISLAPSDRNPTVGLFQVTKDGMLANADLVPRPQRCQSNQFVSFPKIIRTPSLDNALADDKYTSRQEITLINPLIKEINQSSEEPILFFHQLLHQMGKRTSSANHELIAEVLKALREELWSTSQQPKHIGRNEGDATGFLHSRKSLPLYRRAENRMNAKAIDHLCREAMDYPLGSTCSKTGRHIAHNQ